MATGRTDKSKEKKGWINRKTFSVNVNGIK
jgi:hypothetical protein